MTDYNRVLQIKTELAALPKGSISRKIINGREQYYLQGSENGKSFSRYIKKAVFNDVVAAVERRDALREELKQLTGTQPVPLIFTGGDDDYRSPVFTGSLLRSLTSAASQFKPRECLASLNQYLTDPTPGRLCLLIGLRRSGKTVLMHQAAAKLPAEKTAFLSLLPADTFEAVHHDLMKLIRAGVTHVFIDDATSLDSFIANASIFADAYAAMGVKIVLSGTQSLKLLLALEGSLFGRAQSVHTTFLPYRECAALLVSRSLEDHLRHGGTLSFDYQSAFAAADNAALYPQAALTNNITAALTESREAPSHRSLVELIQSGSLSQALDLLLKEADIELLRTVLSTSASVLPESLSEYDAEEALNRLAETNDSHAALLSTTQENDLTDWLEKMDFFAPCPAVDLSTRKQGRRLLPLLPGLRFSRLQSLLQTWLKNCFASLSIQDIRRLKQHFTEAVLEHLLKDLVLLETLKAFSAGITERVFWLQTASSDGLMTILDEANACRLFNICRSDTASPQCAQPLQNAALDAVIESRYGTITEKAVIYLGPDQTINGIRWINAEGYLKGLPKEITQPQAVS